MSTRDEQADENVRKRFEETLNQHGYGFHYSVLKLAKSLNEQGKSSWIFEAAEFPVEVQGSGTRIDFVLKNKLATTTPFYMLAECKRANPAFDWCFARAPFVVRNRSYEPVFMECIQVRVDGARHASADKLEMATGNAYHIALEVKTKEKGDSSGTGKGIIEKAVTQACRGLNGMINLFLDNIQMPIEGKRVYFLPVVFTTANLWASDVDLGSANILDGKVDLSRAGFEKKQWVLYQYHISPGIKHSYSPTKRPSAKSTDI